jgi:hypothetical protein
MAAAPKPKRPPEGHFKLNRMHNPPKPRPPWPRPGSRDRHRVISGQDWAMVANAWGVTEVWDLISWNFGTPGHEKPTPRQVNWYMHHCIGCWRATTDGKNFRFIKADPGWLYIPPIGWSRGMPGLPFHTRVAQALSGLVARYPHFSFAPYTLKPLALQLVRGALNDGRLSARVDSGLKNEVAVYDSGKDEFVFRNDSTASFDARITIAHEATHAALDRKYAGLDLWRWEYEMIAYTAEALWARATDDAAAEAMVGRSDVTGPWA